MIQQQTINATFKSLQIITMAMCGGAALFLSVTFFLNRNRLVLMPQNDPNSIIIYIAVGFALLSVILGSLLFNMLLHKIDTNALAKEKFPKYVSAYIVRYALMEGAALFNAVAFLLSGCLISAGAAFLLIIFMLSIRPRRTKTIEELKIYYPDNLE